MENAVSSKSPVSNGVSGVVFNGTNDDMIWINAVSAVAGMTADYFWCLFAMTLKQNTSSNGPIDTVSINARITSVSRHMACANHTLAIFDPRNRLRVHAFCSRGERSCRAKESGSCVIPRLRSADYDDTACRARQS